MKLRPKEEEKDCTDQLLECTTDCPPNDKECETECVEEYKECDVLDNPEGGCTTRGDQLVKCYEDEKQIDCAELQEDYTVDEGDLISEILQIAALLNGTATRMECLTSAGISSKKIVIEYDVKHKDEVGTD
tara:strand:+ start:2887 stop:3279 length:393 start_codon:yes stop_codon:yes gene_type:complete